MKNKILIVGIALIVLLQGCVTDKIDIVAIRGECIEKFPENYTINRACQKTVCDELNMTVSSHQSWYDPTVTCELKKSRAQIDIGICNTNVPSCQKLCQQRVSIQTCCIRRGAGY